MTPAGNWREVRRHLFVHRGARWGIGLLAAWVVTALAADFLASDKPILLRLGGVVYVCPNLLDPVELRPHTVSTLLVTMGEEDWLVPPLIAWGADEQDKRASPLSPPSTRHWLGTDTARRDVLARMIHGARLSLGVGVVSILLFVFVGTVLGLIAGYFGGWVDTSVSALTETMMSIPVFFLILAIMGVIDQAGTLTMTLVIGLVYWTRVARLVRAETLRLSGMEFVHAAIALGFSDTRVMFRHILPNAFAPILVAASFGVAASVLIEASLSFLGFGTPDAVASWGGLLRGAMGNFHAWWLVLFPGAAVFLTVAACNLVGEALRDALDPRVHHET